MVSPVNPLIILYQLIKFEAPSYDRFWDILITKFHSDPLKGDNSIKGDSSSLKMIGSAIFIEESIYGISKP